jgi:succinate dehydrogenase/fumarate reductase flavoprotein subunit
MVYYENSAGKVVTEEEDIFKPSEEGSFIIGWGIALNHEQLPKYKLALMETDVPEKLKSGEYKQPFYTDLTRLGPNSRDIMWRLMLAHEGKCRVPIYEQFTKWGFDPAKHKLQYPIADYSQFMSFETAWAGAQHTPHNWKGSSGGLTVDWRLQTTLPGLFAAGDGPIASQGCHGESHTAGRYAGRQAAVFAQKNEAIEPDADQIAKAKARVYAPLEAKGDIGWKELNYAVSRLMDDHCSDYLTEHTLDMGIRRIKDLLDVEGERMYANNPHELVRAFESYSIGELAIAVMEGAKARKASNHILGFFRDDYKEEPEEWHKFVGISRQEDDSVNVRLFPTDYHLQGEYSSDLEENYQRYAELDK